MGTNWHTLKLAFKGNQIGVYYDGALVVSTNDPVSPHTSGGISVWRALTAQVGQEDHAARAGRCSRGAFHQPVVRRVATDRQQWRQGLAQPVQRSTRGERHRHEVPTTGQGMAEDVELAVDHVRIPLQGREDDA